MLSHICSPYDMENVSVLYVPDIGVCFLSTPVEITLAKALRKRRSTEICVCGPVGSTERGYRAEKADRQYNVIRPIHDNVKGR